MMGIHTIEKVSYNRVFKKLTIFFTIVIQLKTTKRKEVFRKDFYDTTLHDALSIFDNLVDIYARYSTVIKRDSQTISNLDAEIRTRLKCVRYKDWLTYYIQHIHVYNNNKTIFYVHLEPTTRYYTAKHTGEIYKTKKIRVPKVLVFVDTETKIQHCGQHAIHEFLLGYMEVWVREGKKYWIKEKHFFTKREQFWSVVCRYAVKNTVYVFTYNAQFDFMILWYEDLRLQKQIVVKQIVKTGSTFYVVLKYKNYKKIYFVDAMQFAGRVKLEELGRLLNIYKLDTLKNVNYDTTKVELEELKRYCKRDVEILREYMLKFIEFVSQFASFAVTIARVALNIFRQNFMKTQIQTLHDKKIVDFIRKAYFGGRCENFFLGRYNGSVAKLDVNSMYPHVMFKEKLPTRLVCFVEIKNGDGINELLQFIKKGYLVIVDADIRIPPSRYGLIPLRRKGAVYFVNGDMSTTYRAVLCQPELNLVVIEKVHRFAVFEADYIFKDFVETFWKIRKEAKAKGDVVTDYVAKIIMNSLYGKFAQQNDKCIEFEVSDWPGGIIILEKPARIDLATFTKTVVHNKPIVGLGGKIFTSASVSEKKIARYSNIAISAFITSYARTYLLKLMSLSDKVLYVDTDCLIVPATELNKYKKYIGDDLGQLKCEIYDAIEIRAPKDYTLFKIHNCKPVVIQKTKGVPADAKRIAVMNDTIVYEYERISKFKETFRLLTNGSKTISPRVLKEQKRMRLRAKAYIATNDNFVIPPAVDHIEFLQILKNANEEFSILDKIICCMLYYAKMFMKTIKNIFKFHFC